MRAFDQQCARVGDAWRAGVRHQGHAAALAQCREQLGGGRTLVVRVQGERGALDAVPREEGARGARVLASHQVGCAQHLQGAWAGVGKVADRCGDDVKGSGQGAVSVRQRPIVLVR